MSTLITTSIPMKKTFVQIHPLTSFVILAFALTWPFMIADALGSWGLVSFRLPLSGPGVLLTVLMAYCPTIAALIVTGLTSGKAGIRNLLGRILRWKAAPHWYFVAIVGTGLLYYIALQLSILLGDSAKALPSNVWPVLITNIFLMFLVNGLVNGEEFGWRGFALPSLQKKYSALTSSLILGLIWFLFHLPLFFTRGGGAGGNMSNTPIMAFLLIILSGSVLVTWLFNNTRGSMLFAYLFHAASNTWPMVFASNSQDGLIFWTQAALLVTAAVLVIIIFGPDKLSRLVVTKQPYMIED